MNWRAISAIVRKDMSVALRSKAVSMPLIIVPLILMVGVPLALGSVVALAERMAISETDFQQMHDAIPAALHDAMLADLSPTKAGLVFFLLYLFAPMYLILPIMVSSVVAADSFAGEKERRTLEAIVYTPTTDRELLLGKMLAGWFPGVMVGIGGFLVYTIVADLVAWQVVGRLILPNLFWVLLAFWVGPAAAGLGLGVTVLVSSRVNTFQEAYQMGSLIVLPVVVLMIGQIAGVFFLSDLLVLAIGAVLWLLNGLIFWAGARSFKRSELIARL